MIDSYKALRNWSENHIGGNTFEYNPQRIAEAAADVLNQLDWAQQQGKAQEAELSRLRADINSLASELESLGETYGPSSGYVQRQYTARELRALVGRE